MSAHQTLLPAALLAAGLAAPLAGQHLIDSEPGFRPRSYLGSALAPAGDVDRDGTGDWIVGAPRYGYGSLGDAGVAVVISGRTGLWLAHVIGPRAGTRLGWSVAGLGYGDYAAGGPRDDAGGGANAGYVVVRSGRDGRTIWSRTGEPGSSFGIALATIADLDFDGVRDLAVGAPENTALSPFGSVFIYSGRTGVGIRRITGGNRERFGAALANAGDIDGDGRDELAVGSPAATGGSSNAGAVTLFRTPGNSSVSILSILVGAVYGSPRGGNFGAALANAGDVDGDGRPDLLVGAPGATANFGMGALVSGRTGKLIRRHTGGGLTGFAVAGVGDVDDDGRPDYAIGAPGDTTYGTDAGVTRVRSGRTGRVLFERQGLPFQKCGYAVAGVGDLDGDGRADVAIGVPLALTTAGPQAGIAEVRGWDPEGKAVLFGAGCPGSAGVPRLDASGTLRRSGSMTLELRRSRPSAGAVLFPGLSKSLWGSTPLPLALGPWGMPGCELLIAPLTGIALTTDPSGNADLTLAVPNDPNAAGFRLFSQAFVLDPINALGVVATNGVDVTLDG